MAEQHFYRQTVAATSPASAITAVATPTFEGLRRYRRLVVDALLAGGAGGTLDVYLQRKLDDGTWVDWYHFTQVGVGAAAARFTLDCQAAAKATQTTVGSGTTPLIAAGVLTCAHPGDSVRVVFVAGASTSAGASQEIKITGFDNMAEL